MLKINQFVAKRLESYVTRNCSRNVNKQFLNYVKTLSYITDEQLKQHKGENVPVQVSTIVLSTKLGISDESSRKIISTLCSLSIITRLGTYSFRNKDTNSSDIVNQAYHYSFNQGCEWLGVYLQTDEVTKNHSNITLPNEPFYKEFIHNLKQVTHTWFYNSSIKDALGYKLVFPESRMVTVPTQKLSSLTECLTPIIGNSLIPSSLEYSNSSDKSTNSISSEGSYYSVQFKEEKSQENELKNPSYSLETQKKTEIKKCKKTEQIILNTKVLRASQPHKESRVYTNLTGMKRDQRSTLKWGAERYNIKQADLHAAQIYFAYAMFLQSGGVDDKMRYMLTEVDFYNTMIEETGWEGAWMWDQSLDKMQWVTGRKGFQRYFFAEILYSTCADMRSSKWGTEVFRRKHSDFWQFIYDSKNDVGNDEFSHMKDNARLAHRMAVMEWDHMRAALEYLYEDGYPAVNLHDAIVFPSVVPDSIVVQAINKSFGIYSVLPKIKIENL